MQSTIKRSTADYFSNCVVFLFSDIIELLIKIYGYMREAASAVIDYGFKEMKLSYIEATPPKTNPRSVHLLEQSGFIKDGERSVQGGNGKPLVMWYYLLHNK